MQLEPAKFYREFEKPSDVIQLIKLLMQTVVADFSGQNVSVFCKHESFANLLMGINSSVLTAEYGCDRLKNQTTFNALMLLNLFFV